MEQHKRGCIDKDIARAGELWLGRETVESSVILGGNEIEGRFMRILKGHSKMYWKVLFSFEERPISGGY